MIGSANQTPVDLGDLGDLIRRRAPRPADRPSRPAPAPEPEQGPGPESGRIVKPALEVCGLVKRFGGLTAVAGVSFHVDRGEAVALLGPNGAGKTTTVSMICGLLRPDDGCVRFDGLPIRGDTDPNKRLLGLVPQELALVEELTARENLRFFGALQGLGGRALERAIADGLALVGLTDRAGSVVSSYSGGMKRRLNLAVALLHDPRVILLDEPTVGVDPQSRNAIFDGLEALKARGKSLLYTTHYMEEAERLCDRIVIVDHGRVIADGSLKGLSGLIHRDTRLRLELDSPGDGPWLDRVSALPGVTSARLDDATLVLDLAGLSDAPAVLGALGGLGLVVTHLESERADLATIFLNLTGSTLRDS
ncbi:ABC transporter ATP-binding protein [Tautonia plasticadhaerens]|uniref:Daunorubicin/doxorubicin resistance ATP-binding protein DrrA n=1 Tax=Tautonia plasticadhaerens TaxID=2527974 RepID=A0A518H0S4_9BACT|nr:ABC transporter ATP-binding protein [Tautonia plasticadhaerens]QDV34449.1 Daunorubicin/doxorubicin resistance ATP-binding protein DrrA [Tautonia plasticadhaerens]